MDLQELDTEYKKRLDSAEKNFINSFKDKDSSKKEIKYKEEVKKIRGWYSVEIKKIISGPIKKKAKKEPKKEKYDRFKLKKEDIEVSKIKRFKLKFSIKYFKLSIKVKNFFHSIYYPFFAYYFKTVKYSIVQNYKFIKIRFLRIKNKIKYKIKDIFEKVKYGFIAACKAPVDWIKKLKKEKKKEKAQEVKEDSSNSNQNTDKPVQS